MLTQTQGIQEFYLQKLTQYIMLSLIHIRTKYQTMEKFYIRQLIYPRGYNNSRLQPRIMVSRNYMHGSSTSQSIQKTKILLNQLRRQIGRGRTYQNQCNPFMFWDLLIYNLIIMNVKQGICIIFISRGIGCSLNSIPGGCWPTHFSFFTLLSTFAGGFCSQNRQCQSSLSLTSLTHLHHL